MKLEVISHRPRGVAFPTPLLFVHGAYGAAWVWEPHFLPYFAERGFVVHALSLRGHGASEGAVTLPFARLRDFVADLAQVVDELDTAPVLIGHSMGGMVVQKYLHLRPVPAAVLMASVPPHGMLGTFLGMGFTNPDLFREMARMQALGPSVPDPLMVRRALFADETPDDVVRTYLHRFQGESTLVILDLMGLDLPPSTPMLDLPVLVLGAENDMFVFPGGLQATAETYRTKAEIFPRMAHAMMLDYGWEMVAERIHAWLIATLGLQVPADSAAGSPRRALG
jgi:pimeloyl-ACP methyl ester carboxylesterase